MDEDTTDIFQKLNEMMSDKETADNLKTILNNFTSSSNNSSQASADDSQNTNSTDNNSSIPDFDINTILKIKCAMDKLNSTQNDSRSKLLQSLKPYLQDSKKNKIDQYIKFLKIANVIESLNLSGGDTKNE